MVGQVWAVSAEGGYLYSDELSDYLRAQSQPLTKFRQLCDAEDGTMKGLNRGEKFYWNQCIPSPKRGAPHRGDYRHDQGRAAS
jgi:hypothetical protein